MRKLFYLHIVKNEAFINTTSSTDICKRSYGKSEVAGQWENEDRKSFSWLFAQKHCQRIKAEKSMLILISHICIISMLQTLIHIFAHQVLAENFDFVSIFFADIVDFSALTANCTPNEVKSVLSVVR